MPYTEHPPGRSLAPWVECLWTRHVPDHGGPRRSLVLPDGCTDILFSLGAPFGPCADTPAAWVVGTQRQSLPVEVPPGAAILAVRFRPGGGGPFLRTPLRRVRDSTLPLEEIWGPAARAVLEELATTRHPGQRRGRLRALLRERRPSDAIDPLVTGALAAIRASRGSLPVADLCRELGVGPRRLQRSFADAVGVSPKRLCRIVRARAARRLALEGAARDPLDLVVACGFHDEPHLGRDLRELLGTTPGDLLAAAAPKTG